MGKNALLLAKSRKRNVRKMTPLGDKIFYNITNVIMLFAIIVVLIPIIYVIANSLSSGDMVASGRVFLWPVDFSLEGYKAILEDPDILTGYGNTIFYTVFGTTLNMVLTVLAAWPLSRSDMPGNRAIMMLFAFTMVFNGGLIPNFLLIRDLGIMNTRLALLLPAAINVYNMVICRTFFKTSIPVELMEAAMLDGCSEFKFFTNIALPLSKAMLAVIALYYAVFHWNAFFNAFLYLTDKKLYPLQLILRDILFANKAEVDEAISAEALKYLNRGEVIKYALIMVACVPVWCVYPFVQKHFVKGVMIGSIKG